MVQQHEYDVHGQAQVVVYAEERARVGTGERVAQDVLTLCEHGLEAVVGVGAADYLLGGVLGHHVRAGTEVTAREQPELLELVRGVGQARPRHVQRAAYLARG